jgi:hypothetical protein
VHESTSRSIQPKKLYFLHIPKTAGTSVSSMLAEVALKADLQFRGPFLLDHLGKNPDWQESDILSGHLGQLPIKYNFEYFTIIRDPIERLYSYFSHVKRDVRHYFYDLVSRENMSFESWLLDSRTRNLNYNMQARYLSSMPRFGLQSGIQLVRKSNREEWSVQKKYENGSCSKVSLEKAIRTLTNAIWVGTPQNLGDLQSYLSQLYKVDDLHLPVLNTSSSPRSVFSKSEISAANPLIGLDTILYEAVRSNSIAKGKL